MLGKIAIAAVIAICAAVPLSQINYPDLYNEMYPVNGLKRDVLGLCSQTTATFVRAVAVDRVNCYDSMPDKIDLAIGWVRTIDRAAATKTPTEVQLAEKFLAEAAMRRQFGIIGPPQFTGYVAAPGTARPCAATALTPVAAGTSNPLSEPDARLARRIAKGDDAALATLGLVRPGDPRAAVRGRAMPVLPLAIGSRTAPPPANTAPTAANSGCGTRA